jgi:putative membrane protein
MHRDTQAHERLDKAIGEAEARTDVEMLVALARTSGQYRDLDHVAGATVAGVALAVMLTLHWGDFEIPDEWVVAPAVFAYVAGLVLSRKTFFARRLLSSRTRRATQVKRAARAAFVDEHVHATTRRNGVLFYFSELEHGVEIVADHGVQARVDDATWNSIAHELEAAARAAALEPALVKAVAGVTELLSKKVPKSEKGVDELTRRIRVRP